MFYNKFYRKFEYFRIKILDFLEKQFSETINSKISLRIIFKLLNLPFRGPICNGIYSLMSRS